MGNEQSSPSGDGDSHFGDVSSGGGSVSGKRRGGGASTASLLFENAAQTLVGAAVCGSLKDTLSDNGDRNGEVRRDDFPSKLLGSVRGAASGTCVSPGAMGVSSHENGSSSHYRRRGRGRGFGDSADSDEENDEPPSAASALFARALVSEVTDNPKTMRPADMAEREKRLIRAQERARSAGRG
eukprot:CAMPEP_0113579576 /NCGR_PEP_ID=MMETSP0015_2-20120614/30148_1 /TAXON_ID=2838 /ORGANISM="Odontella" /LENGTH=182 /DNA_ID=CAMNT_0000483577 /DNA_START=46 /DNA_END=590 /DNA_ORIENTATION=- /assembly_acc=CAM_ASM_000160